MIPLHEKKLRVQMALALLSADALYAAVAKHAGYNMDRIGMYEESDDLMERMLEAARAYRHLRFPEQRRAAAKAQAEWSGKVKGAR